MEPPSHGCAKVNNRRENMVKSRAKREVEEVEEVEEVAGVE